MSDCTEPCDGCANRATHHLCEACCEEDVARLTCERDEARKRAGDFERILVREGAYEAAYEYRLAEAIRERDAAREALARIESVGDDGGMTGLDYGDFIGALRRLHTTLKETNEALHAVAAHQKEAMLAAINDDSYASYDGAEVVSTLNAVPLVTEKP